MELYRASGKPIEPEHIKKADAELKEAWDILEQEFGKATSENVTQYQQSLFDTHQYLEDTYPMKGNIQFPRNVTTMKALCKKYGSMAFCIEKDPDTGKEKLICYILDA